MKRTTYKRPTVTKPAKAQREAADGMKPCPLCDGSGTVHGDQSSITKRALGRIR